MIIQELFSRLDIKARLRACFDHLPISPIFGYHIIVLTLIVHLMLGYRRLRDLDNYRAALMVLRLLGLRKLPDVSTVSRALARVDGKSIAKLRRMCREMLIARLQSLWLARVTLDFDGSDLSTGRQAEGAAVGFNKQKKGQRSYYPLFCMIAQTGQVFDVLPRSSNVHDSNGALQFISECIRTIRGACPCIAIEVRMDSAFFSDEIVTAPDAEGIQFTISVPFERFAEIKGIIQGRRRWRRCGSELSYFDAQWKSKKWDIRFRFLFIRQKVKKLSKASVQLDLFIPHEFGYEFKVIVTNKQTTM